MRILFLSLVAAFILQGCSEVSQDESSIYGNLVQDFMNDISVLEKVEDSAPILVLYDEAYKSAYKSEVVTKDNIQALFDEARNFKKAMLIVENHTVVCIKNWEDCTPSNAWGACMPSATGYIKKGALIKQSGYINSIIGIPDNQARTIFFFK